MFRSVSAVDPSAAALSTAWKAARSVKPAVVRPFADHLSVGNVQAEAVVLPFDLALSAQNYATRASRELARAILAAMPKRASVEDVAAAVRVMQALSAYGPRPVGGSGGLLDRLG